MVADQPLTPAVLARPSLEQLWAWLGEIPDPEIPVISITDLGIVRSIAWIDEEDTTSCNITLTPTYSGCPATEVIASQIRQTLREHGITEVKLQTQLSPAWTTDWLTDVAREHLRAYGIAPPSATTSLVQIAGLTPNPALTCPLCGSSRTQSISQFGSTPCKSLHRCLDCMEPFDHFKAH